MPIKSSPYYNSPEIGQAAANLAELFAPPSGADANGWAEANAKKQAASRLQLLYAAGKTPSEQAALTGVQNYGATPQGFNYQVDQTNSTAITNNQADNARAISTNAADNNRAIVTSAFQPLNQGQVRPEISADVLRAIGSPLPALPATKGGAIPLSVDQLNAQNQQRLQQNGMIPDSELHDAILGKETPVQAIAPGATAPTFMSPGAAIRTGAAPYSAAAEAKPLVEGTANINGQDIPVFREANSSTYKTAAGTPIPPDVQVFEQAKPIGTNDQIGKVTDGMRKDAYAGSMAEDATKDILDTFDHPEKMPSMRDYAANAAKDVLPSVAGGVLNSQISDPAQVFYQNIRTALPYQLMSQSGQAVTEQEYQRKMKELVPVPGEAPGVTAAKRRQFATYVEVARKSAGPAWTAIHPAEGSGAVPGTAPVGPLAPGTPVAGAPAVKRFKFDANGNEVQ